jgi:hypothetical protein
LILIFLVPKSKYQNIELEELIAEKKDEANLDLSWKRLTDEDMEIVTDNAIQENKVSDSVYVIIRE